MRYDPYDIYPDPLTPLQREIVKAVPRLEEEFLMDAARRRGPVKPDGMGVVYFMGAIYLAVFLWSLYDEYFAN